jgi:hypothetical protein
MLKRHEINLKERKEQEGEKLRPNLLYALPTYVWEALENFDKNT